MIEALTGDNIPDHPWARMGEFNTPSTNTTTATSTTTTTTTTTIIATYATQDPTQNSDMLNLLPCTYAPKTKGWCFLV